MTEERKSTLPPEWRRHFYKLGAILFGFAFVLGMIVGKWLEGGYNV